MKPSFAVPDARFVPFTLTSGACAFTALYSSRPFVTSERFFDPPLPILAAKTDMKAWLDEVGFPVIPTKPLYAGFVKSEAFVGVGERVAL